MKDSYDLCGFEQSAFHGQHKDEKFYSILKKSKTVLSLVLVFTLLSGILIVPDSIRAKGFVMVVLSSYSLTLDIGHSKYLFAVASDGSDIKYKSSSSRIASVNTYGQITAKKAGTCRITAKCKGAEASCKVTVKKTIITLSKTSYSMENKARIKLSARTSSGASVEWKSSKSSVASVTDTGVVEAQKPGTAKITASADGTKEMVKITVKKPTVTLSKTSITLSPDKTYKLKATVSSGLDVDWKTNKSSVATVDENGLITAVKAGKARICASVDGIKRYCSVTVKK